MFTLFRSHTCITFELLSINLYELIKKNKFQGFSLQLVRKFAHSLLQCLDTLWRNKIIHCDMKPENVLLKQQGRSGIKVGQQLFNFYWKQFLVFIVGGLRKIILSLERAIMCRQTLNIKYILWSSYETCTWPRNVQSFTLSFCTFDCLFSWLICSAWQ